MARLNLWQILLSSLCNLVHLINYRLQKCELVLLEGENQSVNIKLVYREVKSQICGPTLTLKETVLLASTLTQNDVL